jgi:hypothetical protein
MFTDDAYAYGYTGCEPFGPGDDYDIMNSRDYEGDGLAPNREDCPYGFGIETFEHEPSLTLARELVANWPFVCGGTIDRIEALELARKWTGFNYRLLRCAGRVWDRLCDTCETHADAVERYTRWAKKVTKN